jgi:hypothetical protein
MSISSGSGALRSRRIGRIKKQVCLLFCRHFTKCLSSIVSSFLKNLATQILHRFQYSCRLIFNFTRILYRVKHLCVVRTVTLFSINIYTPKAKGSTVSFSSCYPEPCCCSECGILFVGCFLLADLKSNSYPFCCPAHLSAYTLILYR